MNTVDQMLLDTLMLQMELGKAQSRGMPEIQIEIEDEPAKPAHISESNMDKPGLASQIKGVLASTYLLYYKAHAIHWNVEGINFPQYHDFFGDTYGELFSAIDRIAEYIRILGLKAPATIPSLLNGTPKDNMSENDSLDAMLNSFNMDNERIIETIRMTIKIAGHCNEPAIENFMQERLDYHQKLSWKLRVIRK